MSQIIYNKEQVNNNISSNIDNLLDKFEILKNEISQTSIPDDFPYYNYLLSINDLTDSINFSPVKSFSSIKIAASLSDRVFAL